MMRRTLLLVSTFALLAAGLPARAASPAAEPATASIPGSLAGASGPPSAPGPVVGKDGLPASGSRLPAPSGFEGAIVPGELLVAFEPGTGRPERGSLHRALGAGVIERIPRMRIDIVRIPRGRSLVATVAGYEADPSVRYAEPNLRRFPALEPNDPLFGQQWGISNAGQAHQIADPPPATKAGSVDADVDGHNAWDTQTGSNDVVIAVIDTGVSLTHPDLDDSLWVNAGEIPDNGLDDDGNGFPDDVNGWDFAGNDENPSPGTGGGAFHGTHVAGIAAAEQDNDEGISGICPGCRIMALRFKFDTATEVMAIDYAIANGADVINASFGAGGLWSRAEYDAIRRARDAGVLVVVAAGNDASDNDMFLLQNVYGETCIDRTPCSPQFPASYNLSNIIAVAASNHRDEYGYSTGCAHRRNKRVCLFTNWGHDSVDLAAPGVDIMSTIPTSTDPSGYAVANGTSMAAPLVAGTAGLVWSGNPGWTFLEVKNALMNATETPGGMARLYLPGGPYVGPFTRTKGRLNANQALNGSTANATPLTDGNIDGAKLLKRQKKGRVAWPGDVNDVYKKRLRKGKRYEITLAGPKGRDYDLWVWKPGSKEIWQLTLGCYAVGAGACPIVRFSAGATANERVRFKAAKNAVYYIQVSSWFSTGGYTLKIRAI
jgi:subtilisin family serine protease